VELITPGGVIIPNRGIEIPRLRELIPRSPWLPTRVGAELTWPDLPKDVRRLYDKLFKAGTKEEKANILMMAGSLSNYGSKALQDSMWGKTAFTAGTTVYFGLWASALDDTFTSVTTGESAYGSYARLGLTNNTTIFAAGTGTTTYSKTFPSDAAKSFVASTATGTNNTITYLGMLDVLSGAGNGYAWCTVTSTTINLGDTPQLAQNAITVTQD
jgi:hypothetical protein